MEGKICTEKCKSLDFNEFDEPFCTMIGRSVNLNALCEIVNNNNFIKIQPIKSREVPGYLRGWGPLTRPPFKEI